MRTIEIVLCLTLVFLGKASAQQAGCNYSEQLYKTVQPLRNVGGFRGCEITVICDEEDLLSVQVLYAEGPEQVYCFAEVFDPTGKSVSERQSSPILLRKGRVVTLDFRLHPAYAKGATQTTRLRLHLTPNSLTKNGPMARQADFALTKSWCFQVDGCAVNSRPKLPVAYSATPVMGARWESGPISSFPEWTVSKESRGDTIIKLDKTFPHLQQLATALGIQNKVYGNLKTGIWYWLPSAFRLASDDGKFELERTYSGEGSQEVVIRAKLTPAIAPAVNTVLTTLLTHNFGKETTVEPLPLSKLEAAASGGNFGSNTTIINEEPHAATNLIFEYRTNREGAAHFSLAVGSQLGLAGQVVLRSAGQAVLDDQLITYSLSLTPPGIRYLKPGELSGNTAASSLFYNEFCNPYQPTELRVIAVGNNGPELIGWSLRGKEAIKERPAYIGATKTSRDLFRRLALDNERILVRYIKGKTSPDDDCTEAVLQTFNRSLSQIERWIDVPFTPDVPLALNVTIEVKSKQLNVDNPNTTVREFSRSATNSDMRIGPFYSLPGELISFTYRLSIETATGRYTSPWSTLTSSGPAVISTASLMKMFPGSF